MFSPMGTHTQTHTRSFIKPFLSPLIGVTKEAAASQKDHGPMNLALLHLAV